MAGDSEPRNLSRVQILERQRASFQAALVSAGTKAEARELRDRIENINRDLENIATGRFRVGHP